jgi:Uma2 family endonuclease
LRISRLGHPTPSFIIPIVTCEGALQNKYYSERPVLIVEVISPSTERADRLEKLPAYKAMPSVLEILIVDQEKIAIEIHRRVNSVEWADEYLPMTHLSSHPWV